MAYTEEELKKELESQEYQYGFTTDIDSETFPVGLNEDIVKAISKKKNEPEWMTQWRLEAYSCLLYTSPSPGDLSTSRMPSSA